MYLFAFCLRHPSTPINIREKFAITSNIDNAYKHFIEQQIPALIISTCNRSELYMYLPSEDYNSILHWWANFCGSDVQILNKYIDIYTSNQAIMHLFEVTCGIDSIVLGETQITGQIKQAYGKAIEHKALNPILHAMLQKALACAKDVRNNTNIGRFSISFAAAGASLAQKIFNNMHQQKMLFIGAGEMMHTVIPHFSRYNPKHITIANRNQNNIVKLINNRLEHYKQNIKSINLLQIDNYIDEFDIIVSCLDYDNQHIINHNQIKRAMKVRRYKPLYILDLSVPLVIDKQIKNLDDVFFYNVDDLGNLLEEGHAKRNEAKQEANLIIKNYVHSLNLWHQQYAAKPLIKQISRNMELQIQKSLDYAIKKHGKHINSIDENTLQILQHAMHKFSQINKHDWLQLINNLDTRQQQELENYFINKIKKI